MKRAGDFPGSTVSIHDFLTDKENVAWTEVFLLMCPDESFDAETMDILEQAVAGGKGILCYHGVHPCYRDWPAMAAGSSLAGIIILGPIGVIGGAFVKGKDIDMPAGTEMYIQTKGDTVLYGVTTTLATK